MVSTHLFVIKKLDIWQFEFSVLSVAAKNQFWENMEFSQASRWQLILMYTFETIVVIFGNVILHWFEKAKRGACINEFQFFILWLADYSNFDLSRLVPGGVGSVAFWIYSTVSVKIETTIFNHHNLFIYNNCFWKITSSTLLYKAFSIVHRVILVNQVWRYSCFHWKQL